MESLNGILNYLEINQEKFKKNDIEDIESNPSNKLKETTPKKEDKEPLHNIYYDPVSKRIITVQLDTIQILNKKGTNIKAEFAFQTPKNSVILASVDKENSFLIVLMTYKDIPKFFVMNIKEMNVMFVFSDNLLKNILGLFFITQKEFTLHEMQKEKKPYAPCYCVVYTNMFEIFEIKDKITKKVQVVFSKNALIKSYTYNPKYKILCVFRNDNQFEFFNFSNPKHYSKSFKYIPDFLVQLKKTKSFSFFNSKEDMASEQRRIAESYFCKDRYIESQFFLEEIYDSLYLIILSYEKNMIYFYKISALNKISLFTSIEYQTHSHCSSLQFVDNLVIVHNFISKIILVIDLKASEQIINVSKTNFPYEKNYFINGEILEEKSYDYRGSFKAYYTTFNSSYYIDTIFNSSTIEGEEKKFLGETNIFSIQNLLRRKDSSFLILDCIYKMIIDKAQCDDVFFIFDELIKQIKENTNKMILFSQNLMSSENENKKSKNKIPDAEVLIKSNMGKIFIKQQILKQKDFYHYLFQKFIDEKGTTEENLKDAIFYLYILYKKLFENKVQIEQGFYKIFLNILSKIKDLTLLRNTLLQLAIPSFKDLADFVLFTAYYNIDFEQLAFDILIRLRRFETIIKYLISKQRIVELFNFLERYNHMLKKEDFKVIFENLEEIKKNKQFMTMLMK
ncbi:MAG: hypothetical protein MJ252_05235, partial [archaeon]|nr:hypothetical protein [archaeon]